MSNNWVTVLCVMFGISFAVDVHVRMWVRMPAWPVETLVSLSKTFILRMGRKAVGPVCCVMHAKEPRTLIVKEKVFLDSINVQQLRDCFVHHVWNFVCS